MATKYRADPKVNLWHTRPPARGATGKNHNGHATTLGAGGTKAIARSVLVFNYSETKQLIAALWVEIRWLNCWDSTGSRESWGISRTELAE